MNEDAGVMRARRRIRKVQNIRDMFTMTVGAAAGLGVLGVVRLLSNQAEVFPTVLVPALVIVSIIGELAIRRSYGAALDDLDLASRNAERRALSDTAAEPIGSASH